MLRDMTRDELNLVVQLSVCHDTGKSLIPSSLLHKSEALTKDELEQLRTHTEWGKHLIDFAIPDLRGTKVFQFAREICHHHHERWDGNGYPDGLLGNETPIYVQIIALADSYDALVSPRSYRPAFSHSQSVEMILSGCCGAFSPRLISLLRENAERISSEVYCQG